MKYSLQEIGERFKAYLSVKSISGNKLGMMSGTSGQQVANIIHAKTYGFDKLIKILSVLPDLNTEWLLHGHGEMLVLYDDDGVLPSNLDRIPGGNLKGNLKGNLTDNFQNQKYFSEAAEPQAAYASAKQQQETTEEAIQRCMAELQGHLLAMQRRLAALEQSGPASSKKRG